MKNPIVIILLVLIIAMTTSCINSGIAKKQDSPNPGINQVNKSDIEKVISDYIIIHRGAGLKPATKFFEAHKIYGIEYPNNIIQIYMYFFILGYSFVDGSFKPDAGGNAPALLELVNNDGTYEVVNFREAQYSKEEYEFFPKEYADNISNDKDKSIVLYDQIHQKAEAWIKSQGRTEKVIRLGE